MSGKEIGRASSAYNRDTEANYQYYRELGAGESIAAKLGRRYTDGQRERAAGMDKALSDHADQMHPVRKR